MATVAPSSDQAAELMQKLSLEPQSKTLEAPEATKKSAAFKRGSTDSKEANGTTLPTDRSTTAANPEFADPNMCYVPNGYASGYYYGYDGSMDWDEYSRYLNTDATGVYGDNSSLLYHGYGYSPYGPYSPATSPVPSMGHDGLYGPQQYQYPTYYQNPTTPNEPYNATKDTAKPAELSTSTATDKPALSVEVPNGSSKGSVNGASNGSLPLRPSQQNPSLNSSASYGRGTVTGGLPSSGYVDPRYNFDGLKSPLPWYDTTSYTDTKNRSGTNYSSVSHANSIQAGRNQSLRPFSNLMGLQSPGHTTGIGATPGYMNRYYPNNRMYGQYGSNYRTGSGYGSTGYDSRTYGRGWLTFDGKYKTKGRGNGLNP